jgi:transcriptional regulator with XRE-family HTH domain
MVLLRRMIGDALRARRQAQQRTLREVSTAANVSLGYLSEIERGQKEASSELLSSICDALGAQLSDVLREVSDTMALAEQVSDMVVPADETPVRTAATAPAPDTAPAARAATAKASNVKAVAGGAVAGGAVAGKAVAGKAVAGGATEAVTDGRVSVAVHREGPLKTTLRARPVRDGDARGRDVIYAA